MKRKKCKDLENIEKMFEICEKCGSLFYPMYNGDTICQAHKFDFNDDQNK